VRQARDQWKAHRQPRMREGVHRLVFLDETGTTTKMTRLRGRARRGARLKADAPFGHWATQTFIAGLRCDGLTAPWVVDQPMNRQIFDTYVETQLAPTLQPGDVVILDNLASHKSAKPRRSSSSAELGSSSCRLTARTSIRSKWRSPSSRPISGASAQEPSIRSAKPSVTSAPSTPSRSAGTISKTLAMRPIKRSVL
jgi:hypothetical protein